MTVTHVKQMISALLLMFSSSQTLSMKSGLICLSILFTVGIFSHLSLRMLALGILTLSFSEECVSPLVAVCRIVLYLSSSSHGGSLWFLLTVHEVSAGPIVFCNQTVAPVNRTLSWNLSSCVNVSSLLFSKVSRGDRGGPVVHHQWRTIPSLPSLPSSFFICCREPPHGSQCPCHPCCLLTCTSLPARWHAAWWPVLFLFWRLWKGGWVRTRTTVKLQKAFVSLCFAVLAN